MKIFLFPSDSLRACLYEKRLFLFLFSVNISFPAELVQLHQVLFKKLRFLAVGTSLGLLLKFFYLFQQIIRTHRLLYKG